MRYADSLAELFKSSDTTLDILALGRIAGLTDRLGDWCVAAQERKPNLNLDTMESLFETTATGSLRDIEAALVSPEVRKLYKTSVFYDDELPTDELFHRALLIAINPLVLLGRGDVLVQLYENSLVRTLTDFEATVTAVEKLGEAGEWGYALAILRAAARHCANIRMSASDESALWKLAYVHGGVETVLPELAELPIRTDRENERESRMWELVAYQIRSGRADIQVPALEGDQTSGYMDAVAAQIAAIEDDPSSDDLVDKLRHRYRSQSVEMIFADQGISVRFSYFEQALMKARAQEAAKRRDTVKALALADLPRSVMLDPPADVIEAFLQERDWRAAALIAELHDERDRPVPEGFDDDRLYQYVLLRNTLVLAAARSGDDKAAAAFLAMAKEAEAERQLTLPEEDRDEPGRNRFVWLETLLAGVSEGLLPRNLLDVLGRTVFFR